MAGKASSSMVRLGSRTPAKPDLHSASIHISNFPEATNPSPQGQGDRANSVREPLNQGFLSPMKLVQLTEEPDLSKVTYLELSINTSENSVGNFGAHLPNLSQLRFASSSIACVRDLGTSLGALKVLWMPCCKLKDLDGLPALQNLQELYLPFNNVEDISVITMLSSLDVLDLESNNIVEEDQLGYLALCTSLVSVTLEGNPLSVTLAETTGSEAGYRAAVREAAPNLQMLDDLPLREKPRADSAGAGKEEEDMTACSSVFALSEAGMEKDWRILQQSIKQGLQLERDVVSPVARPMTAPARSELPATIVPTQSESQLTLVSVPPGSVSISPTPAPPSVVDADESSELTHGLNLVICGNPVRALRTRKQHGLTSQSTMVQVTTPPCSPSDEGFLMQLQDSSLQPISEDITVTRAMSEENLFTETQQPAHLSRLPTPPTRLPTPPKTAPPSAQPSQPSQPRPKSVADFRHRRYRKPSAETPRSFTKPSTTNSTTPELVQHHNSVL